MFIKKTSCPVAESGFSLIELLLVMTLAPIIFFAVYSNFSSGVHLWQRMQVGTPEEDEVIFRVKTQRDFQNVMHYASMPFLGEKEEVSFTAGMEGDDAVGGQRAVGRIRYFYDESARAIARETKDFSQVYKEAVGQVTLMARDVRSFEVAYLVKDTLENDYIWKEEYRPEKPDDIPLAVRLIYTAQSSTENIEQTFFIPAGGSLK